MRKKQIQKPLDYSPRQEVTEDILSFDASMFQTDAPSAASLEEDAGERQERKEIDERIQALYPSQYEKKIPIDQLVPAPDAWNFFPQPDRETMQRLMQSILDYGLLHPGIVWQQEDGTYMILGGHTRCLALKNLLKLFPERAESLRMMRCNVYAHDQLDENQARQIIIMDNTTQRQKEVKSVMIASVIHMGQLMKEKRAGHYAKWYEKRKRINDIIGESLGVSSSTVKGILRFRTLIPEFLPFLDKRTADGSFLKLGQAQALAKLPRELQQLIYQDELYRDEYFGNIPAKELEEVQTLDDVRQLLIGARKEEAATGDYQTVRFPVLTAEYDVVCEVLLQAIRQSDRISEQTKECVETALGK